MRRIHSIDFCRGLVMIIMALDHTRDFLHVDSIAQSPTDLTTTTPVLFFTRWITHLCAPTFVFLSGVSAWISGRNHPDTRENRIFLFKRGVWLIILELTLVNFFVWMDIRFRLFIFEVIGTFGAGFILLSLLYKLSPRTLAVLGLILIFGHDLLSAVLPSMDSQPVLKFVTSLFLRRDIFPLTKNLTFDIAYPVLPWFGMMLCGFASGRLFEYPADQRKKIFFRIGFAALGLFVVLRLINGYGDPVPWSVQKNAVFTVLSFLNVAKYAPSLLFTLVTLGILFILLSLSDDKDNRFTKIVSVYGKTPLFYFLIHLLLIHLIMFAMLFLQGFHTSDLVFGPFQNGRPEKGSGLSLSGVYLVWIGVVLLLYPLCVRYGRYKTSHRENKWLRYL